MSRAASSAVARYAESFALHLPPLHLVFSEQVRETIARAAEFAREALHQAYPENWAGFALDEVLAVVGVMEATGICLVWTPRQEIVQEVLDDTNQDAFALVEARRADILEDLEQCLIAVDHSTLAELRAAAAEAISADRAGFHRSAQALCASVLTSIIHGPLGAKEIRDAHKDFAEAHPREAGISQLRLRSIYVAAEMALADYNPLKDRPPHGRFNRHNSAHRVTEKQFTPRNSLVALMLVVPFLRELNYWLSLPPQEADEDEG
jgi:hypothetical protein